MRLQKRYSTKTDTNLNIYVHINTIHVIHNKKFHGVSRENVALAGRLLLSCYFYYVLRFYKRVSTGRTTRPGSGGGGGRRQRVRSAVSRRHRYRRRGS